MKATRTCSTPECDRPVMAREMCQKCYGRAYRAGEIQPRLKVGIHSLSHVNVESETAVCAICGPTRIRVRTGRRGHECGAKRWRSGAPGKSATLPDGTAYASLEGPPRWMWDKYRVTPERYAEMWLSQDGLCKICDLDADLVVDHCHATGRVRGLLCHRCNVALGWMDDRPDRLRSAATYLELA